MAAGACHAREAPKRGTKKKTPTAMTDIKTSPMKKYPALPDLFRIIVSKRFVAKQRFLRRPGTVLARRTRQHERKEYDA